MYGEQWWIQGRAEPAPPPHPLSIYVCLTVVLDSHKSSDTTKYGEEGNFSTSTWRWNVKKCSASRRLCFHDPLIGAVPLDFAGGCAPDPRYRLMLCAHHTAPLSLIPGSAHDGIVSSQFSRLLLFWLGIIQKRRHRSLGKRAEKYN